MLRTVEFQLNVSLHYGSPQIAIGAVFAGLAFVWAFSFLVVARKGGSDINHGRVRHVGAKQDDVRALGAVKSQKQPPPVLTPETVEPVS